MSTRQMRVTFLAAATVVNDDDGNDDDVDAAEQTAAVAAAAADDDDGGEGGDGDRPPLVAYWLARLSPTDRKVLSLKPHQCHSTFLGPDRLLPEASEAMNEPNGISHPSFGHIKDASDAFEGVNYFNYLTNIADSVVPRPGERRFFFNAQQQLSKKQRRALLPTGSLSITRM